MTNGGVRRPLTMMFGTAVMLCAACGNGPATVAGPAECVHVVEESGTKTDQCLPVAPDGERVDLATPTFGSPTPITNPLHPTSEVTQVIMGGHVEGKPFRTEVTRLPSTEPITWRGTTVDTAIVQYVAYLDGRIHEVTIDWYAQADDGSVWYFGEDVSNFEDGKVADTNGTWKASDATPAAMIMPASPAVGDVYRPENAPEVVFEQVRVEKVDQTVPGPNGDIRGAIDVMELHMDGSTEGKVFAPGYGEFSTGNPGADLEAVSLASPIDSRKGPVPAEFDALSVAATGVFDTVAEADAGGVKQAASALNQAWEAVLPKGIPPQLNSQMAVDIDALNGAVAEGDWRAAESAALRIAQNELDLRLLYHPVLDVDLARLALWARQLPVDVRAGDAGLVLADVAALDRVWERTRPGVQDPAAVAAAMRALRHAADAEDLRAVDEAAASLSRAISALHTH